MREDSSEIGERKEESTERRLTEAEGRDSQDFNEWTHSREHVRFASANRDV